MSSGLEWPGNAGMLSLPDLRGTRVNREREVDDLVDVLINSDRNVLLFGDRGIGKTFLSRLICEELKERSASHFILT